MMHDLTWLNGMIHLSWWGYVLVALAATHITIASVTIFLHRHQAHRSVELHPLLSHFFRFWLWMTTGMVTKEWTAVHRKHHAFCEREGDPHSPRLVGIKKVLLQGVELYKVEARNPETLKRFGQGTPDDWLERHVYAAHAKLGISLMLIIDVVLFGPIGLTIWAVQMLWIPLMAAGIINGLGHYLGYRNFEVNDTSTNIFPLGILIGGEELHNNHHAFPMSAKLSTQWYEFDIGWLYICIFHMLGLATIKKTLPEYTIDPSKSVPDFSSLRAITTHRYTVLIKYANLMWILGQKELRACDQNCALAPKSARQWWNLLRKDVSLLTEEEHRDVQQLLNSSSYLAMLYDFYRNLQGLWARSNASEEELVTSLQAWCNRAQASGIPELVDFSRYLTRFA